MKTILLLLSLSLSSFSAEPPETRAATAEEKAYLLEHMGEEGLKRFGRNYAIESEIIEAEFALMSLFKKNGELNKKASEGYIQHLTNRGYNEEDIQQRIAGLMKGYFNNLQIAGYDEAISKEDRKAFEKRLALAETEAQKEAVFKDIQDMMLDSDKTKAHEKSAEKLGGHFYRALASKEFKKKEMPLPSPETIELMVPKDFSLSKAKKVEDPSAPQTYCVQKPLKSISEQAEDLGNQMQAVITPPDEKDADKNGIQEVWIAWGYNRSWHSQSDAMFKTLYGDFTIHDAHGDDVPKKFGIYYFHPERISIPQYNLEIGVMFNDKWGMDLKMDHMKWKFDRLRDYEITGDFSKKVWSTKGPQKTFEQAKADMDASWLRFEHTDGYNYISLGLIRNFKILESKSGNFDVDARVSAGGGALVPRTDVRLYYQKDDGDSDRYGINNKFHIAGYGAHADARLKVTFWDRFFIQAVARGSRIKVKNALVDGSGASLEHTPINSFQIIGQAGYQYKFDMKSKKEKAKEELERRKASQN